MPITTSLAAATRTALSFLALLLCAAVPASAAVSTWTAAGATSDFSDALNWDAFPTPDCDLVFPSGAPWAAKGAPVNDIVGLEVNAINIYESYVITGNAISCKIINDNTASPVIVALPLRTAGSAALTITVTTGGATLNLTGRISGAGPVTYGGPGIKRLAGSVDNTLSGVSTVALGSLVLDSAAAVSVAGPLVVNSGATAILLAAPEIKDTALVTVDGTFDLSAATGSDGTATETIGGLAGTGVVTLGAKTLGAAGQPAPTVFAGGFSGTGGFRQALGGTQVFSGTSFPYTGTTTLTGGAVHVWGTLTDSPVAVSGGTLVLAGGGTVGAVVLSGGAASAIGFDETISAMTMHGTTSSLTVGSGSVFQVVSRSPTMYSFVSTATAAIGGATLSIDTSNFTPTVGSVMLIIDNTGGSPVSGTFAGLTQGATVASSSNAGTTFTISYAGGDGNDVTLTGTAVALDSTAPAISAVGAGSLTGSSATISWTTDELSDSQVEYGTTATYGSLTAVAPTLVTAHGVGLSGLAGATLYHYRVSSRDAAGNRATGADATFTTTADTTGPVQTVIAVDSVTGTTARVTWTTDEASDSQVAYGPTAAYGSLTTLDGSLVTAHIVALSGLTLSTVYHYQVLSRDAAGNLTTSGDATFTTTDGTVAGSGGTSSGRCGSGSVLALLALVGLLSLRLRGGRRGQAAARRVA
jgi:hypothetical protein